jgi:CHAD domain-containing protein
MALNLLSRYLISQLTVFDRNYPHILDTGYPEAIHDVRVSIKKIRTLFLLLDFIYPSIFNAPLIYKSYKKLFRQLGGIRDLQVQIKLTDHYETKTHSKIVPYREFLQERHANAINQLTTWQNQYHPPSNNSIESVIRSYYLKTGKEKINNKAKEYIQSKLTQVLTLVDHKDKETIHLIRRLLKEARYMTDMLNTVSKVKDANTKLLTDIKSIENFLGDWHDRMISLEFIYQFEKEQMIFPSHRKCNMRKVVKRILAENNSLVNKSIRHIIKMNSFTKYIN